MKMKKVSEFKPYEKPLKIKEESSIREMVESLLQHPEKHQLCVVDHSDKMIGLISRKRVFRAVFSHHVPADSRLQELFTLLTSEKAGDLVLRDILTIHENDDIDEVISILTQRKLFELPVVDEQKNILGFLSVDMILKAWLKEIEDSEN